MDKGMKHKQKIVFSGEGDQEPGLVPGDVVIVLNQRDHPVFKRDDSNNLHMEKEISLLEALCGFSFTVRHLDGRTLLIRSNPADTIIKPGKNKIPFFFLARQRCVCVVCLPCLHQVRLTGDVKEITGEGMPTWKRPFDKGLLVVKFSVKFPDYIDPKHFPVHTAFFFFFKKKTNKQTNVVCVDNICMRSGFDTHFASSTRTYGHIAR